MAWGQAVRGVRKLKLYPAWMCHDCGVAARGGPLRALAGAAYYKSKCEVCGKVRSVTEPRDYGYPEFKGHRLA